VRCAVMRYVTVAYAGPAYSDSTHSSPTRQKNPGRSQPGATAYSISLQSTQLVLARGNLRRRQTAVPHVCQRHEQHEQPGVCYLPAREALQRPSRQARLRNASGTKECAEAPAAGRARRFTVERILPHTLHAEDTATDREKSKAANRFARPQRATKSILDSAMRHSDANALFLIT